MSIWYARRAKGRGLAALFVLALATPASAAEVSVETPTDSDTPRALLRAKASERNLVGASVDGQALVVRDLNGVPMTPGTGCTAIDATSVRCAVGPRLHVLLGDGNDRIDPTPGVTITGEGGTGNDHVNGKVLMGNDGDDRLQCPEEFNRAGGCRFDGGAGRDTLQGAGGPDILAGGPGSDELLGFGGDDFLLESGLQDASGPVLDSDRDGLACDLGNDLYVADPNVDVTNACERVHAEWLPRLRAGVKHDWLAFADGTTRAQRTFVLDVIPNTRVELRCTSTGRRCPWRNKVRDYPSGTARSEITDLIGRRSFPTGAKLEVRFSAGLGYAQKIVRFKFRRRAVPTRQVRCARPDGRAEFFCVNRQGVIQDFEP